MVPASTLRHFARHLPHLTWQPSDVEENIAGIGLWRDEAGLPNLLEPIVLDIDDAPLARLRCRRRVHRQHLAHRLLAQSAARCSSVPGPCFLRTVCWRCMGLFNYGGLHTSESNARFDLMLRQRDPRSGIRDFEKVDESGFGDTDCGS